MQPNSPPDPFVVGEDEGDSMNQGTVSPLSQATQKSDGQQSDAWNAARFSSSGFEYGYGEYGHAISSQEIEIEGSTTSVHFNKVKWEKNGQLPNSTTFSAEEFRPPGEKSVDEGLGIHVSEFGGEALNNEKTSWQLAHPPASAYRPNTHKNFEDVELSRTQKRSLQISKKKRACIESKFRIMLWALVIILPFMVLPLAIFGGVYHWGSPKRLCKVGGGSWDGAKHSCQY